MGETSIAWTDRTRNLLYGCLKVDVDPRTGACFDCYIFRNLPRYGVDPNKLTYLSLENAIRDFAKWSKDPSVTRVFLNNYSDTFHEEIPFAVIDSWVDSLVVPFPRLQVQLLTKRIGRAMVYWRKRGSVPPNVWMGTTIGAKDRLRRLDQLRQIEAQVKWVSAEPLLEDLDDFSLSGIQWIVVGGESGFHPRPMRLEWAENLRRIARRDGVAYFFKQVGGAGFDGVGGCLLNGVEYKEYPPSA